MKTTIVQVRDERIAVCYSSLDEFKEKISLLEDEYGIIGVDLLKDFISLKTI